MSTLIIFLYTLYFNNFDVYAEQWTGDVDTTWYTDNEYEQDLYIDTPEELAGLAQLVNNSNSFEGYNITLTSDIYLNNVEWTSIGKNSLYQQFKGTFDGDGHTVYGLNVVSGLGLFGYIGEGGSVKRLTVEGTINTPEKWVGGIASFNDGKISECCSRVNIVADGYIGGICAHSDGEIINSYNVGNLVAIDGPVAGIAYYSNNISIINCHNVGNLSGYITSGIACYNSVVIDGCFCMNGKGTDLLCSQNIGEVTNSMMLAGYEFKTESNFINAGWDFTDVWYMGNNYPELKSYKPHVHSEIVDKSVSATCTDKGLTEGKHCSVCGEVIVEQYELEPLGHSLVYHTHKDASCTETGNTEYWKCDRCNKFFSDDKGINEIVDNSIIIPVINHTYDKEIVDEKYIKNLADCVNPATYYKSCKCGAKGTETFNYGEPNGHSSIIDKEIPATCTETGLTSGSHCSICNTILEKQEVIKALGHDWDDGEITTHATCTQDGVKTFHCKRDNCIEILNEKIECNGHTEDTIEKKEPTCTSSGSTAGKKCSACGLTLEQPQEIPATGHKWDEGKITQSPTSALPGTRTYTCTVCGETKTEEIPKLPAEDKKTDTTQPSTSSQTTPETYSFEATVQENTGSTVLVKGLSTNNVNYRGSFYLTISKNTVIEKNGTKIDISKLTKGTQVTVYYSGTIAETSPGQIFDVRKIVVTKEATTPKTTKVPSKPTLSPLKNTKGKKMVIKWKKVKNAKGYQVEWALDSKFKKSKKSKTLSQLTFTAKNLKKSKTYYVRVRAYTKDSKGKKVYGKWSTVKKITIKK